MKGKNSDAFISTDKQPRDWKRGLSHKFPLFCQTDGEGLAEISVFRWKYLRQTQDTPFN